MNNCFSFVFISLISFYKLVLSPYMGWNCRFYPTCSSYSLEAFKQYNCLKASYLTIKRIIKCRPFGPQGYDPVESCECKLSWSKHG